MQQRYRIEPAELRLQSLNFAVISLVNNTNSLLRGFTQEVRAIQQTLQATPDLPVGISDTLVAINDTLDTMVENQHTILRVLREIGDSPFTRPEVE